MKKSGFLWNVLKLVSGTTVAQLITILCAPLLSRIYRPEDYGAYNVFISCVTLVLGVLCLGYEMAILLPAEDGEAASLFWASLGTALFISVLTLPIVTWGKDWIAQMINSPELSGYLWLLPICLLFGGIDYGHPTLNYWATRRNHFGKLATARIVSTVCTIFLQIAAGIVGPGLGRSLIISAIVGGALSAILLFAQLWKEDGRFLAGHFDLQKIIKGITRYRKFPLFDSWTTLINYASWFLPSFLLARYFSLKEVGLYGFTIRFLAIPMVLIGGAIAQVFTKQAVSAKAEGRLADLLENVLRSLIAFGMFPMLVVAMIAPSLFKVVFGPQWVESGVYTQILVVWMIVWFVSSPLFNVFYILEKQDYYLAFSIVVFVLRCVALVIGGWLGNARWALALFALSGILTHGYILIKIIFDCGVPRSRVKGIIINYVIKFLPAGAMIFAALLLKATDLMQLALAALALAIYVYFEARSFPQIRGLLFRLRVPVG